MNDWEQAPPVATLETPTKPAWASAPPVQAAPAWSQAPPVETNNVAAAKPAWMDAPPVAQAPASPSPQPSPSTEDRDAFEGGGALPINWKQQNEQAYKNIASDIANAPADISHAQEAVAAQDSAQFHQLAANVGKAAITAGRAVGIPMDLAQSHQAASASEAGQQRQSADQSLGQIQNPAVQFAANQAVALGVPAVAQAAGGLPAAVVTAAAQGLGDADRPVTHAALNAAAMMAPGGKFLRGYPTAALTGAGLSAADQVSKSMGEGKSVMESLRSLDPAEAGKSSLFMLGLHGTFRALHGMFGGKVPPEIEAKLDAAQTPQQLDAVLAEARAATAAAPAPASPPASPPATEPPPTPAVPPGSSLPEIKAAQAPAANVQPPPQEISDDELRAVMRDEQQLDAWREQQAQPPPQGQERPRPIPPPSGAVEARTAQDTAQPLPVDPGASQPPALPSQAPTGTEQADSLSPPTPSREALPRPESLEQQPAQAGLETRGTVSPVAEAQGAGRTPPPQQAPQRPGGNEQTYYHGTNEDYADAKISTGQGMFGIHLTTDESAAKDYGKNVKQFTLTPDAKVLDLSDGGDLWAFMQKHGVIDAEDAASVDLENYTTGGQLFQYDLSSKTHFADHVAQTAKALGYDVVKMPDDLGGKGDNVAHVVVNEKVLQPKSFNQPAPAPTGGIAQPAPAEVKPPEQAKQPWQMTKAETRKAIGAKTWNQKGDNDFQRMHREAVEQAVEDGRPVPPEVLRDYPDLAKPPEQPTTPPGPKPKSFGFDRVKMADNLTLNELTQLRDSITNDPANANPAHAAGKSIYLYKPSAQKKLDNIGWAVFNKMKDQGGEPAAAVPRDAPTTPPGPINRPPPVPPPKGEGTAEPLTLTAEEKSALNAPMPETEMRGAGPAAIGSPEFTAKAADAPTGIKNATQEIERAVHGIPSRDLPDPVTFEQAKAHAVKTLAENPQAGAELVESLLKDPQRPLRMEEVPLLLHRQLEIDRHISSTNEKIIEAYDKGDEAALAEHNARWSVLNDQYKDLMDVSSRGGTASARGLGVRRMMVNQDFSLAAMESRKRAAKRGEPLTKEESAQIKQLHDRIAELEKQTAAHAEQGNEAAAQEASKADFQRKRMVIAKERAGSGDKQRDTAGERTAIVEGIKGAVKSGDDAGAYIQKLALGFVREGVTDREKLIDAVHGAIKDIVPEGWTRRRTMDAISGYGDFKQLNPEAARATLRDLKGQMQQVGKLQDMQAGSAPAKTGVERRTPSDEERRLIQQVNEAKRRGGFVSTDPATQLKSALESIKTRLKNQVSDLEYQITTGKKIVKDKSAPPADAESDALRARRDDLKQQYDQIFGGKEISDEQRVKLAMDATARSIAEYERRIKEGDLFPAKAASKTPKTPELEAARARRDALKEELQQLQDLAQPGKGAEQIKAEQLQKTIDDLSARIAAGDLSPQNRQKMGVDTEPVAKLKAQRDALNAQLADLRKAAKPVKTPEQIALQAFKTRTANRIAELQDKLARDDFSGPPPRTDLKLDPKGQALKAQLERYKQLFDQGLQRDRLKQRTPWEKTQDTFVKWRRAFLLSSPVTIAKLASAAAERMAFTPGEEVVGGALGKLIPGVSSRAAREGGISVQAEARAITEGFTKGSRDAWQTLKTGKSDLDILYGKDNRLPPTAIDFIGTVHGALKAQTKRNEFARSFQKRVEWSMRNGLDPTDPTVQSRIAIDSYKDANRSIFMQDNRVVSAYKRAMSALKEKSKETGRVPTLSKGLATGAETVLPIVKVPTNIVAETMQYAVGSVTGTARLARAYARGIDTLKPAEADLIMRSLKKGSVGAAVMALGYFGADRIGGYYQPGQKRDQADVKFGRIRVFGHEIPSFLVHNPLLECLQIGATVRRVADSRLRKSDSDTQGIAAGTLAAAVGVLEEVPFVREVTQLDKLLDPHQRTKAAGEYAKSIVVPAAVDWTARQMDKDAAGETVQRKPETALQTIQTGIPGLRNLVPPTSGAKSARADANRVQRPARPRR